MIHFRTVSDRWIWWHSLAYVNQAFHFHEGAMEETCEREGFGVVRLGEVSSYGHWAALDGQLEISFESRSLSVDKQEELEHYRNSSVPIQVQIPGERRPVRGVVIGFLRDDRSAKFFVTRHMPKTSQDEASPFPRE
jgi:hypothetical protein